MGTFERWRRAFGAIKDSTTVGLAKVTSDFKKIDIAIVKATNHEECPPKDLYVKRIIVATSFAAPRADVGYCIHTLCRRLTKTKNWIVAVKTLIVFHRILREGDSSFREELLTYSRRQHIFQIPEFRDESSQLAWDCSLWIRTYALFLEERLECYRVLGFDVEMERLTTSPGLDRAYSRTRVMNIDGLLDQLPAMQQLLHRLIGCQLEGAACHNGLIQHAFALVLKESFKIYNAINDGMSRLVELFFDLPKDDAVNALNIYKKAGKQAEKLGDFYNLVKHLPLATNIQFPTLIQHPPSFHATMKEYVKGVSLNNLVSNKNHEHQNVTEEQSPLEIKEVEIKEVENQEVMHDQEDKSMPLQKVEEALPLISIDDDECHDLNETSAKFVELNVTNVSRSPHLKGTTCLGWNENEKTSSWELAVVTLPNNNATPISQAKLGGELDQMLLYSLYEDDTTNKQKQNEFGMQHMSHHHHPPSQYNYFKMPGKVAPPQTTMHTIMMQQKTVQQPYQQYHNQYQQWYQHQQNRLKAYNHQRSSNQYLRQMSNP